jgi:DHA3 family macrolide efflux protein-like MFS transporter
MQGRVFTLINSFAGAMSPIGLLIAGPVGDLFGVQIWFIISGTFVVLMGVVSFFIPVIVHVEDNRQVALIERETPQAQAIPPGN